MINSQIFYAVLGVILICFAISVLSTELIRRIRCSATVDATIVDTYIRIECVGNAHHHVKYYYPVYEYEVNGRKYRGTPNQCSKMENWFQIGEQAKINYCPRNPNEMTVKRNVSEFIFGGSFMTAGIICVLIALFRF